MKEKTFSEKTTFAYGLFVGAFVWLAICYFGGKREAWDAEVYHWAGIPLFCLYSFIAGYLIPRRAWRWGFAVMLPQPLIMVIQNPHANLLPIGLVVLCFLSIPTVASAWLGAWLSRRLNGKNS